jgi:hypothetical protein
MKWAINQTWFTPLVNLITIPILAWTAWEALRSSRAANEANELKLLPLLGIYFYYVRNGEDRFTIKNLGDGVAYDIAIDPWTLIMQDAQELIECKMSISGTNLLAKGEEKDIYFEVEVNGQKLTRSNSMMTAAMRSYSTDIQILFKDATGKKWITTIKTSEKQVSIVRPPQRFGLIGKVSHWYGMKVQRTVKIRIEKFFWKHEKKMTGKIPSFWARIFNVIKKLF